MSAIPRIFLISASFMLWVNSAPAQETRHLFAPQTTGAAQKPALPGLPVARHDVPVMTPETTQAVLAALDKKIAIPTSPLADYYARRTGEELPQFGYDLFTQSGDGNAGTKTNNAPPMGAVQDDFILHSGDRLSLTFRGQRSHTQIVTIDSTGRLLVDDLLPITAAGRSIAQVRNELRAQAGLRHNTEIFLALESVRQADILVLGHVRAPGRKNMTVFSNVMEALNAAGGIDYTGSLRQIKLVRDGRSRIIDLYDLLLHGGDHNDITLRHGDRIVVPPLGPTVAVAGHVKRPGIYEIRPVLHNRPHVPQPASETLSLQDMLYLAGGTIRPGQNRFLHLHVTESGHDKGDEIRDPHKPIFADGAVLMVAPADEMRAGMVTLRGHTRKPGLHAITKAKTLSALLADGQAFGDDIYPLAGVIVRQDRKNMTRRLIDFAPVLLQDRRYDRALKEGDEIHLFSRAQIMALGAEKPDVEPVSSASPTSDHHISPAAALPADAHAITDKDIVTFLRERAAFTRGAVRHAGSWPVAEGVTLSQLIAVSGGLTLEAHKGNIELTRRHAAREHDASRRQTIDYTQDEAAAIAIAPGDSLHVKQKFPRVADSSVQITGEVTNPGHYDLMPGDRLSDLLRRAGGLSDNAYPPGAIFSRGSERRLEENRFRAQAQDLEMKLAAALKQKDEPDGTQIAVVQDLIAQLKQAEAIGRITVEADPGVLAVDPDLDILLEPGDRIHVPQRPLTVRVAGEVLSPASLQFRKDRTARDYIMQAGGYSWHADKNRAFVVYPDGSAQPLAVGSWNHNPVFVPPGATIIVPRDPKPFDFIETARDVSQILSNLAITGIFIDDIRND